METNLFAQHQNNPPDLIFMLSQQLHYQTSGFTGGLEKKKKKTLAKQLFYFFILV